MSAKKLQFRLLEISNRYIWKNRLGVWPLQILAKMIRHQEDSNPGILRIGKTYQPLGHRATIRGGCQRQ
uniref:Uncharacterized protein n=1 Tax=Caenorhabditis japonica TaxID=281687 RepID=A0A8R1E9I1_CAEJA